MSTTTNPAVPTVPTGVRIVGRTGHNPTTARRMWAQSGTAIDDTTADAMVIVAAAWGTNATMTPDTPHVGIGRGHARPFIATDAMTCRVCRVHMTASAFPTLSRPTADGRTRNDRCRACRDHTTNGVRSPLTTHADYVAAGRPDRTRHMVTDAPAADPAPARRRSTRTRTTPATPTPDVTDATTDGTAATA